MPWARIQNRTRKKALGGGEGRDRVYKNIFQGRVVESTISTNPDLTVMIKYSFYIKLTKD